MIIKGESMARATRSDTHLYKVEGELLTIREIVEAYDLEENEKYMYMLAKKHGHRQDCIEQYMRRNEYL